MEEQETKSNYGQCTVGYGSREERKIDILDFIRYQYIDHRLITICRTEEGYGLTIENPQSTGRSVGQNMLLTEESLIALISSAMMYLNARGLNLSELLAKTVTGDNIQIDYSENIDPLKLTQQIDNQ